MNKLPRRIISASLAVGLLAGSAAGWSYYRSGSNYRPNSSSAALKQNSVVFPSQEQSVTGEGKTADDSTWQQDQSADTSRRPENSGNTEQSIQLPANFAQTPDQTLLDTSTPDQTPPQEDTTPPDTTPPDTTTPTQPDNTYIVTPDDPANPDNVLPSIPDLPTVPGNGDSNNNNNDNVIVPGDNNGDNSVIIIPGGGETILPGGDDSGNTGGSGDTPSTPDNPSQPSDPSQPDNPDQPSKPSTPTQPDTPPIGPDDRVSADDVPAAPDSVVHPGLLPSDPYQEGFFTGKDFNTDTGIDNKNNSSSGNTGGSTGGDSGSTGGDSGNTGGSTGGDSEEQKKYTYSLQVLTGELSTQLTRFYVGQHINAADFFQACYFHILEQPEGEAALTYHITDYGENFRVGAFPATVTDNDFTVTFYYRLNTNTNDWYKKDVTFSPVRCELRLLTSYDYGRDADTASDGEEDYTTGQPIHIYPDDGDNTYDLSRYFYLMHIKKYWGLTDASNADLPQLFPGWSETPGGESVGNTYTVSGDATGLIELYPMDMIDVPEGYTAKLKAEIFPLLPGDQEADFTAQLYQTITQVPEPLDFFDLGEIDLPEGTQILNLSFNWVFTDAMNLPSTLLRIDGVEQISANNGFTVSDGNPCFTTEDGVLYDKDKTELMAMPSNSLYQLTIPETVTKIDVTSFPYSIFTINFLGDTPPEFNASALPSFCEVSIPAAGEVAYYAKLYEVLSSSYSSIALTVVEEDGTTRPCSLQAQDGLILSEDGTTLLAILSTVNGTCTLPGTVETIASGALDNAPGVTTLIVPGSVTTIEENALNGAGLTEILFAGATPPTLYNSSVIPDGVSAFASPESVDDYQKAWGDDVAVQPKQFYLHDQDGWRYLEDVSADMVHSVTLLDAPSDLTLFDEDTLKAALGDVEITAIGDYAFSGCDQLTLAILPDSVSSLGQFVFYGCSALEGVFSARTDFISLQETSFWVTSSSYQTGNLRFVALNSMETDLGEVYSVGYPFYVPDDGEGYPTMLGGVKRRGPGYLLEKNPDGGYLLYSAPRAHGSADAEYGAHEDEDEYIFSDPEDGSSPAVGTLLLSATTDIQGTITLRDDTLKIYNRAFSSCANAFSIARCERMTWVAPHAFEYSGVTSVDFPYMDLIEAYAFYCCSNLTGLNTGDADVQFIGDNAFSYCSSLSSLDLSSSTDLYNIGKSAFAYCVSLTDLDLSASVTMQRIHEYAFTNSGLQHITFGTNESGIELDIGWSAFQATSLEELTIPAYVTKVGTDLITDTALEEITFLSAAPPMLTSYSANYQSTLKLLDGVPDPNLRVVLAGDAVGHELDYVAMWSEAYAPAVAQGQEKDIAAGEALVRALFGLPATTEGGDTPVESNPGETPAVEETGDGSLPVVTDTPAAQPTAPDSSAPDTGKSDSAPAPEPDSEPADTPDNTPADEPDSEPIPDDESAAPDASDAQTQPAPADNAGAEEGEENDY